MAIEFCRRDGKIPEVRAGARMVFIVVIEDGLHFIDETARTQWKNEVHASLA